MELITKNAKAVVAVLAIVVAGIANALGVDSGIDATYWWQVIGASVIGGGFVWSVPNKEE